MNPRCLLILAPIVFLPGRLISQTSAATDWSSNPFNKESTLPYKAPQFDKIKDEHYKPALEEGIKQQLNEIRKIADNPASPTFENTIVAMEKTGQLLNRVSAAFSGVSGANTNNTLQKLQEEMAPKLEAVNNEIFLNTKLFKRIESIYNNRSKLKQNAEAQRLIEVIYQRFVMAGAKLSETDKAQLKKLSEEDASLSARFTNLLVSANKAGSLVVADQSELEGLSANDLAAYAQAAKARNLEGNWVIPLQNTTQQPALQSLKNRATRHKLFDASWNRAEKNDSNDTRAILLRMASIRAEKAKLMGSPSFAAWKLQDQMAKNPETVDHFFEQLIPSVVAKASQEAQDIQKLIDEQKAGFQLQPWDWDHYAEQVRKAKYDLDANEVKPYFELSTVLEKGVFYAANQLYGLTFKPRHDIPVYQADLKVYEVFDADGKALALFYGDYFKRDNKRGGAWMSNFVVQSKLLGTKPVIYNVCNFTKPAEGQPALISFDDVRTMFHEFGHALHGIFANQTYPTLSGTRVARDFVEFPSQFNEHWSLDPKILKNYALHYQTGAVIPQTLVDKIKNASTFNAGYSLAEQIQASLLDMQWHKLPADQTVKDVDEFEKDALSRTGINLPQVPPRYRSSYFSHIWTNNYSAGYYAYQWTKMLAEDAYSWFEEHHGLSRANGQRFRNMILSRGNTEDLAKLFRAFRGHDPDIKAMQKNLGLTERKAFEP
jgi:peptidyl-dipeptidase Dcp